MKIKLKSVLLILLIIIILAIIFGFYLFNMLMSPVVSDKLNPEYKQFSVKIPRGSGLKTVGQNLYENDMIKSSLVFYIYSRFTKPQMRLKI